MSLSATVSEKANLIWAIADKLTGTFKPHQYGEIILPLTVLRRFDNVLADSKDAVLKAFEQYGSSPLKDAMLKKASGYQFYNTSRFTFESIIESPNDIEENFVNYLNGFSQNIKELVEKFHSFRDHVTLMAGNKILYWVLKEFTTPKANLHPDAVSNLEMGYIFEELIRRFSEAHNEDAGQHYTPREVIELMVNIVFSFDRDTLSGEEVTKTIYDPACGTGGMLSVADSYIHKLNPKANLLLSGQEINDETFAICKADMLIKGNQADFIKSGNTLSADAFSGHTFDYILSNPPFGREWKNEKSAVEREARDADGRFGPGLPSISDSQMLFLLTAVSKLKPNGRAAIIQNGSPLFTGDAGSGPSEIRRYILENDLLEAIVALPNDIFYNTGIATYIWVLCKGKPENRKGKVLLINANGMFEKRRKSLGNKRNDIPQSAIDQITRLYGDFVESPVSKIFDVQDFGYTKIIIERPAEDSETEAHATAAASASGAQQLSLAPDMPTPQTKRRGRKSTKAKKQKADPSLRDTENVPLKEDIDAYFEREVKPYAPDAWIDRDKSKVGYEIPFTRYFYEYTPPRPATEIAVEIRDLSLKINSDLNDLLSDEV